MTNPETGAAWPQPEIPENLALDLLRQGQPLGDEWVEAIAAFLATLTDRRYEPLLVHGDTLP